MAVKKVSKDYFAERNFKNVQKLNKILYDKTHFTLNEFFNLY